jgi:hypothetical protein
VLRDQSVSLVRLRVQLGLTYPTYPWAQNVAVVIRLRFGGGVGMFARLALGVVDGHTE